MWRFGALRFFLLLISQQPRPPDEGGDRRGTLLQQKQKKKKFKVLKLSLQHALAAQPGVRRSLFGDVLGCLHLFIGAGSLGVLG